MDVIKRTLDMGNGNKVTFTAGPITPFWSISFERGGIPKELDGFYTDFNDAVYRVKTYLERRAAANRTTLVEDSLKEVVNEKSGNSPSKQPKQGTDNRSNRA